ncbi:MAG: DNA mismatch repair endonuclease MutL [Dehalococcoidia bacterium]|nr:DNA mismatch repair endonuclease MutL [Dehalococcoidia bacterium]MSQ16888.1 DNA mismatch repair endonuclease MutL [Dehalococcoidia bacterium]
MPIQVLPSALAAQIAAGEVVERPASVVKELLENSLDAGASQITVELRSGGLELVRITDDGSGIPASEVELAFQRHATSKLQTTEQLGAIATLGFRGEALPSIAAVSRLTIISRTHHDNTGYRLELDRGHKLRDGAQGSPPGTSVTVEDLFGNVPARRKFLRSASAEASRVHELVAHYTLAYPAIRFQLVVDERSSLSSPGNGRPAEALLAVYGAEVAAGMLEVRGEDTEAGYQVAGFASAPSLHRANRSYMTFFVNRRWVQNRLLAFAVEEAYHDLLPERRYPVAVLNLTLPYDQVDVNCHPSKREVRFHQERRVYAALQRAVRAALVAQTPVPLAGRSAFAAGRQSQAVPAAASDSFWSRAGNGPGEVPPAPLSQRGDRGDFPPPPGAAGPRQDLPALKVVGQVKQTYIVAEGPQGLYLVDQHAAHERVLFDQLRRRADQVLSQSASPPMEGLLEPVVVELTPQQAELMRASGDRLRGYGFQVESFGEGSYLLRALPSVMGGKDPAQSLKDVLDLAALDGAMTAQEDALAASIACHSAIRAGKTLSESEMRALLEQLEATDNPHTCPHGRPTMIHLTEYQMEREFRRR